MNTTRALVLPLLFCISTTLHAAQRYEYAGRPFSFATGPFTTADAVNGFVEFALPPTPSGSLDETEIVDYAFTAGPLALTPATPGSTVFASFNFDALGQIETWVITVTGFAPGTDNAEDESINTDWNGIDGDDFVQIDNLTGGFAENALTPGEWTLVPEPGCALLAITACAALIVPSRRPTRRRSESR